MSTSEFKFQVARRIAKQSRPRGGRLGDPGSIRDRLAAHQAAVYPGRASAASPENRPKTVLKQAIKLAATKFKDIAEVEGDPGHRFRGVSLGWDKKKGGYLVYTHRAASKRYPEIDKIPDSIIKRIRSTG